MQGASEQCMHATETDFSWPMMPSLIVTTRRRFTPQGTSCSRLHAVAQALHSMQRSVSHMNFIRAMAISSAREAFDIADGGLGLLHHGDRVIAIGGSRVDRLAAHNRRRPFRVILQQVLALPPARE